MARNILLVAVALTLGFVAGHLVAGRRAARELDGVAFVHAVEGAGLAANSLLLLERGDDAILAGVYRGRMRDELGRAEGLMTAVRRVEFPLPNLVEGLVRAEARCRVDPELAATAAVARRVHDHLAALHAAALEETAPAAEGRSTQGEPSRDG